MASPDEGGGDQQPPAPPLTVGHHTTSRQPLSHMQLHLAAAFGLAMSPTIARSLSPTAVPSPTTPGDDLQPLYPSHATLQPPHSHHPHQIPLITSPSQTCVSNPGQSHASHHHQPPPTICCLPSFTLVKTALHLSLAISDPAPAATDVSNDHSLPTTHLCKSMLVIFLKS